MLQNSGNETKNYIERCQVSTNEYLQYFFDCECFITQALKYETRNYRERCQLSPTPNEYLQYFFDSGCFTSQVRIAKTIEKDFKYHLTIIYSNFWQWMLYDSGNEKKTVKKDVNYHQTSIYSIFWQWMLYNSGTEKKLLRKMSIITKRVFTVFLTVNASQLR